MMTLRYEKQVWMSVSQVEEYAACHFRHFASHVLHLEERDLFCVETWETGTIVHKVLELAVKAYMEESEKASDMQERIQIHEEYLRRDFRAWAKDLFAEACREEQNKVSGDPSLMMGSGEKMLRISEKSLQAAFKQIDPAGFVPENTEWSYGYEPIPPISIQLPGNGLDVFLRGKIDRVDVDRNRNLFRVLDYKTGNKKVDYREIYAGLSVQLPAYLYAYASWDPALSPASAGYFHLTAPMAALPKADHDRLEEETGKAHDREFAVRAIDLEPDDMELCSRQAIKRIAGHCEKLFDGDFSIQPVFLRKHGDRQVCSYCEFKSVCGIDPQRPPYGFPPEMPEYVSEDGKAYKEKDRYVRALREEISPKKGGSV
jgi:ATP-dependent helicase/nuclease subunit B